MLMPFVELEQRLRQSQAVAKSNLGAHWCESARKLLEHVTLLHLAKHTPFSA
jgi:hypothetical protein